MKINVHTHVFNFKSILTKETILLLKHRLTGLNIPDPFRELILSYFRTRRRSRRGEISLNDFNRTIRRLGSFDRLIPRKLRRLFDHHLETSSSSSAVNELLMSLLESAILERSDASSSSSIINLFEWLRIGLMKNIDDVTDDLMAHLDEDDVVVLLPMDIIDKKAGKRERQLYLHQLEDTEKQSLRYPGRILPFGMINPVRNESFELFKSSIDSGACVGLKLYPSLGYSIDNTSVKNALRYCNDHSVPVLLHGNDRGFRKSAKAAEYCNPKHWIPVLDELHDLKVCFGHFGGETQAGRDIWTHTELPDNSWASAILKLMESYSGRVFADVSFHTGHWDDETKQQNYQHNMQEVLSDERYKDQVLWGTDYHFLRLNTTDTHYTQKFIEMLGDEGFARISKSNPVKYLGLPSAENQAGANITRYVNRLIQEKASAVQGKPASWLLEHESLDQEAFGEWLLSASEAWDINNLIHRSMFQFIWTPEDVPKYLDKGARSFIDKNLDTIEEKFEAIGRLPLADLTYFSHGPSTDIIDDQKLRGFCTDVMFWYRRKTNADRIGPSDDNLLYSKLQNVAGKSDNKIQDVASVIAKFYRFPVT